MARLRGPKVYQGINPGQLSARLLPKLLYNHSGPKKIYISHGHTQCAQGLHQDMNSEVTPRGAEKLFEVLYIKPSSAVSKATALPTILFF